MSATSDARRRWSTQVYLSDSGVAGVLDILLTIEGLEALAVENKITGIVHCGAHSGPMVARENPHSMVQVNIVGTANMLEIARIHGVGRETVKSRLRYALDKLKTRLHP